MGESAAVPPSLPGRKISHPTSPPGLAQGRAAVDLQPSRERVEAIIAQAERYYGAAKRGRVWDRLLREYCYLRVIADVTVERILA
jgi:hypothetical protein